MLDIRRALAFLTEDPQVAEKVGLGAVISVVPILNLASFGYEVELARRVARSEPQPLPAWGALGQLWRQGAWLGLAYFVYSLPIFLLMMVGLVGGFVGLVGLAQNDTSQSVATTMTALLLAGFGLIIVLALVYGLVLSVFRPALVALYAQRPTFGTCFDVRGMWQFIMQQPRDYALLWGAELVLGWVISLPVMLVAVATSIIPLLGPLVIWAVGGLLSIVLLAINGHLVGQLLAARARLST